MDDVSYHGLFLCYLLILNEGVNTISRCPELRFFSRCEHFEESIGHRLAFLLSFPPPKCFVLLPDYPAPRSADSERRASDIGLIFITASIQIKLPLAYDPDARILSKRDINGCLCAFDLPSTLFYTYRYTKQYVCFKICIPPIFVHFIDPGISSLSTYLK